MSQAGKRALSDLCPDGSSAKGISLRVSKWDGERNEGAGSSPRTWKPGANVDEMPTCQAVDGTHCRTRGLSIYVKIRKPYMAPRRDRDSEMVLRTE